MRYVWDNFIMDRVALLVSKLDSWLWRKRWDNYTRSKYNKKRRKK